MESESKGEIIFSGGRIMNGKTPNRVRPAVYSFTRRYQGGEIRITFTAERNGSRFFVRESADNGTGQLYDTVQKHRLRGTDAKALGRQLYRISMEEARDIAEREGLNIVDYTKED